MLFVFTPKTPAAMRGLASAALFLCVCCAAAAAPLDAPEEQPGLFEGDIIEVKFQGKRNLVIDRQRLWPNKTLVYQIGDEFHLLEVKWIQQAIAFLQNKTCVKFKERTDDDKHYLYLRNKMGCAAPVGFHPVGKVEMYLQLPNCVKWGTIQHEFLHALGFWHEHTRPDRDNYVGVQWDNVRTGAESNFFARKPSEAQYENMPYDYHSVMHYRNNAFATDSSKPTLVPFDKNATIGQRKRVSRIDVAKLNRLYECGTDFYLGDELVQEKRPNLHNEINYENEV